jgi:hypothetical protein
MVWVLMAAFGCTPATAPSRGSGPAPSQVASASSTSSAPSASAVVARLPIDEAVCRGKSECRIVARRDAGTVGGDDLLVVETWLGARGYEPGVHEDGGCPDFEWWSVVLHAGSPPCVQLLVAGGNECLQWGGQAATVGPNSFTYVFAGSGAPILVKGLPITTVIQLTPLKILSGASANPIHAPDDPMLDYRGW